MDNQLHAVCTACNAVNRIPAQRDRNEINCGKCHRPLFGGDPPSVNRAGLSAQLTKSPTTPHSRPTLFVWGERNFNALIADSEQMYQAPKLLGVDTQLVI